MKIFIDSIRLEKLSVSLYELKLRLIGQNRKNCEQILNELESILYDGSNNYNKERSNVEVTSELEKSSKCELNKKIGKFDKEDFNIGSKRPIKRRNLEHEHHPPPKSPEFCPRHFQANRFEKNLERIEKTTLPCMKTENIDILFLFDSQGLRLSEEKIGLKQKVALISISGLKLANLTSSWWANRKCNNCDESCWNFRYIVINVGVNDYLCNESFPILEEITSNIYNHHKNIKNLIFVKPFVNSLFPKSNSKMFKENVEIYEAQCQKLIQKDIKFFYFCPKDYNEKYHPKGGLHLDRRFANTIFIKLFNELSDMTENFTNNMNNFKITQTMTFKNEDTVSMEGNDSSSEKSIQKEEKIISPMNSEKNVIQDTESHSPHPDTLDIGKDFENEFEENMTEEKTSEEKVTDENMTDSEKSIDSPLIPKRIPVVDVNDLEERSKSAENRQHTFTNNNYLLKYQYRPILMKLKAAPYPFEIPSLVVRSSLGTNETIRTIIFCDLSKELQDLDEGIIQFHSKIVSISHVLLLAKISLVNVTTLTARFINNQRQPISNKSLTFPDNVYSIFQVTPGMIKLLKRARSENVLLSVGPNSEKSSKKFFDIYQPDFRPSNLIKSFHIM